MSDKRTVATDALETLGTVIDETAGRDAIHLAVEPVIAGMTLRPGEDIGFLEDGTAGIVDKPLGIVDPFLKASVKKGQRFWLVVYPRQITSLRHVWAHPAFPSGGKATAVVTDQKAASEKWLREFCEMADCPRYESVIATAVAHATGSDGHWNDEALFFQDTDAHGDIPPEFWKHIEIVTGIKAPEEKRATHFSCSC